MRTSRQQTALDVVNGWANQFEQGAKELHDVAAMLQEEFDGVPEAAALPPIDRSSRDAFIRSMLPYARKAAAKDGIPAEYLIAIPLNEQGWEYEAPGNNYFGIKADPGWTGPTTGPVATWEDYGEGRVDTMGTFRAYPSPAESFEDFGNFLRENSRYAHALDVLRDTRNGAAFIREVHAAGYATDPEWSMKIISRAGIVRSLM